MVYQVDDTIVAVASAAGGAARGILRLSGPATIACLQACFRPAGNRQLPTRQATLVMGHLELNSPIGPLDCQVYVWPTRRSYTRQPAAEIHTLGSPPLLDAALQILCQHGARLAEPGEFTLRAFLAGRLDLTQAEAVLGVIDATNQQQLDVSLAQLAGGLSGKLNDLRDRLLNLCADIEAGLDFVDEDIEFVSAEDVTRQLREVEETIAGVLQQMKLRGESKFTPRVVLHGRPNAGKSTLWNALSSRPTAITSDTPGTTRDYLEVEIDVNGMRCTMIDTAGVDPQPLSPIDAAAQTIASRSHKQAHLQVLCLDGSEPLHAWDAEQLSRQEPPDIVLLTKSDALSKSWRADRCGFGWTATAGTGHTALRRADSERVFEAMHISCHAKLGLQRLCNAIEVKLQEKLNQESSVVGATATRCHESLRRGTEAVVRARRLAASHAGDELVAAEVRNALTELGTVVGAVYTDDVLDRIFSRFCVGK